MPHSFILTAPHIILRPVRPDDDKQILSAMACPDIHAMHSNGFCDLASVQRYIAVLLQEYQKGIFRTLAIAGRESNMLCGAIIMDIHPHFPRAELGYWVSIPHRNKGYACQAVRAVIHDAFLNKHLKRIQAVCSIDNPASARVLEKAGMKCEGILRLYNGIQDEKMYAAVAADFPALNGAGGAARSGLCL